MKRILITGAGGVLGTELIQQLTEQGTSHLVIISSQKDALAKRINYDKFEVYNMAEWEEEINFNEIDVIVHGAFSRNEQGDELVKSLYFTERLLIKAAQANKKIGFVNISSRSIYGQNENYPWDEQVFPMPENKYALGKIATEVLADAISELTEIKATSIRLAGLIGKNMDARIISRFIKAAIENHEIKIIGGNQHFSFLDTRDAASAIIGLLDLPVDDWKNIYNVGSAEQFTLAELAKMVADISHEFLKEDVRIIHEEKEITLLDEMDSGLFISQTNWKQKYKMEDTIRFLFDHYLK